MSVLIPTMIGKHHLKLDMPGEFSNKVLQKCLTTTVQRQDRPAEPLAADGERNHLRTGAGVAIVQRKAVSVLAVAALPAYQAAGSSLLGRGYAVGGAVRPVFQRWQVLIGSFAHASLRFLWRVLFPRCLSIDELLYWSSFLVTLCSEIMLYIETPLVSYSYSLNEVSHSCTS